MNIVIIGGSRGIGKAAARELLQDGNIVLIVGRTPKTLEEIREKYGFDAHAIVTMQDVIDHLYNKPYKGQVYIDDTLKKAIDEYYAVYGA